jgi:hypothetical protein
VILSPPAALQSCILYDSRHFPLGMHWIAYQLQLMMSSTFRSHVAMAAWAEEAVHGQNCPGGGEINCRTTSVIMTLWPTQDRSHRTKKDGGTKSGIWKPGFLRATCNQCHVFCVTCVAR